MLVFYMILTIHECRKVTHPLSTVSYDFWRSDRLSNVTYRVIVKPHKLKIEFHLYQEATYNIAHSKIRFIFVKLEQGEY